ncbi:DUF2989 domain-containing protein [Colwellia sp. TT2012]|uniref:DUF2989 domain-containing protein n=1 Tax=Colwellia sp. TT2012 TaxID=1720342 RepID=UPI00070D3A57|nr:DUF2989 domain-containing protein [Colwellia sp. TT2012]
MITFRKIIQLRFPLVSKCWPLILVLTLNACDSSVTLMQLCKENEEICNDFGQDSWCKTQRNQVTFARINVKDKNLDVDKYSLLVAYEGYIKCMSLASQIQHIKLKEKTTLRKDNLITAQANLSLLTEQSVQTKHPHLLYYHWSREGNTLALAEFLKLEGTPILENSTAQLHLATYYIKRDRNKTLGLLYRALELHQPGTELPAEILQTLATIFTQKKQYKQAYIWLRTYQLLQDKPDQRIEANLKNYQQAKSLDAKFLDKVARTTLAKITAGQFTSPSY